MASIEEIKYEKLSIAISKCETSEAFNKIKALIEAEPSALKITNKLGLSALNEAIYCPSDEYGVKLFSLFLSHGANVNHLDIMGASILEFVVQRQNETLLEILLQDPSLDLNTKSIHGSNALMHAIRQARKPEMQTETQRVRYDKSLRIIDKLLRAGASTQNIDDLNRSLSDILQFDDRYRLIAPDIQALFIHIEQETISATAPFSAFTADVVKKKQIKI